MKLSAHYEIRNLLLWVEGETHSKNKARRAHAVKCLQELDQNERAAVISWSLGKDPVQIVDPVLIQQKLSALDRTDYVIKRKDTCWKNLGRWKDNLINGRISSNLVVKAIQKSNFRVKSQNAIVTTCQGNFTNKTDLHAEFLSHTVPAGHYVIRHCNLATNNSPQEQVGIHTTKNGFHIALAEVQSSERFHSPLEIAVDKKCRKTDYFKATEQLINTTLSAPLMNRSADRILKNDDISDITLGLLEVEMQKVKGKTEVRWLDKGTSSLMIVNAQGNILYPTAQDIAEKNTVYVRTFNEPVFVIGCSKGVSELFKNENGSLNSDKFQKAFTNDPGQVLSCFSITDSVKKAAQEKAKTTVTGSDITIAVLKLQ